MGIVLTDREEIIFQMVLDLHNELSSIKDTLVHLRNRSPSYVSAVVEVLDGKLQPDDDIMMTVISKVFGVTKEQAPLKVLELFNTARP